jgi:hypothetical protein
MKKIYVVFILLFGFFSAANAQTTYDWQLTAPDGNWKQGASGAARWNPGGLWDEPPFGVIRFDNNHQLTMTNNVTGTYNQFMMVFGAGNTTTRTISGNPMGFFDFGGNNPKIENFSNANHVVNLNFAGDPNNPLEVNFYNTGNLIFNGNVDNNGSFINLFGTVVGRTAEFNGVVSGAGGFGVNQGQILFLNNTNTYAGNTEVNFGELWINTTGNAIANNNIFIGNGGAPADVSKIFLSRTAGGTNFTRDFTLNPGNTTTRYFGSLNTSGTNEFSGVINNNSTNGIEAEVVNAGGTLRCSNNITGAIGSTITKIGAGILEYSGTAKTYTGTTKINAGTLRLAAANQIADGSRLLLNGGTFSNGATTGFTETLGQLELTENSTIALGTGASTLTFAASDLVPWTAGKTLTITGWNGSCNGRIFVGTANTHLTATQLAQINFSGYGTGASLSATGELLPAIYNNVIVTSTLGTATAAGYATLGAAFGAINGGLLHLGVIKISIYANISESSPTTANLNQVAGVTSVLIVPAGCGARTLTGSATTVSLINLFGADNVTIDGLNTNGNSLTIDNPSTLNTADGSTIRFQGDASNNIVTNCTVLGSTTMVNTTIGGTITFSTGTTTGNDNNIISNCNIGPSGANLPRKAIFFGGSSTIAGVETVNNSGNTITNCNIFDYFNATTASSGLYLTTGTEKTTITNNKFYQTATRTSITTASDYSAIHITGNAAVQTHAQDITITGNTIGYASSTGIGTTTYTGAVASKFFPIRFNGGTAVSSTISNNTIAGLSLTTTSAATTIPGIFAAIRVEAGTTNVNSNTIGVPTTGPISMTSTTGGSLGIIHGILLSGTGSMNVQSNTMQAISTTGTATVVYAFHGISLTGAGVYNVTSNTIGSTVAANSISLGTLGTTTAACTFYGITSAATGNLTIGGALGAGNTIQNIVMNPVAANTFVGLRTNTGVNTNTTISYNTIAGIRFPGALTHASTFTGILNNSAVTGAINITNNNLGTATLDLVTYTAAPSGAFTGITNTAGAATCALTIQNNDIRGIVNSVAGSSPHTYINNTAATLSQNISSNTFTALDVNTTGNVTFISNDVALPTGGSLVASSNSLAGTIPTTSFSFRKIGAGGTVTLYLTTNAPSSVTTTTKTAQTNNFSNISLTGATTFNGWMDIEGATAGLTKTITGNTFSNWTCGSGAVTALQVGYCLGTSSVSTNSISNITGSGAITGISLLSNNVVIASVNSNTISGLSTTGTGGAVTGILSSSPTSTFNGNTISSLSSTSTTATVAGISSSGATSTIRNNTINTLSNVASTSGATNGIMVTSGITVNVFKNKIYDLNTSGAFTTAPGVNGIVLSGTSSAATTNVYNNYIGDLRAATSASTDAIRGISVTATGTTSNYNVYFNTLYLAGTSSGVNFGTAGLYHAASATTTTAKLDLQNNIIINLSVPTGTGVSAVLRRSTAATLGNFATTSNRNLLYAGVPSASRVILADAATMYQTFGPAATAGTYQNLVGAREAASITGEVPTFDYTATSGSTQFFTSLTPSNSQYLHVLPGITTQVESGGANTTAPVVADDYDADIRAGNAGYVGTGTSPDMGADEFAGITPSPSITANNFYLTTTTTSGAAAQCATTARDVLVNISTPAGTISTVTLAWSFNGTPSGSTAMTLNSGTTTSGVWIGTIPVATPANATVTWSVSATNSISVTKLYTGVPSYTDAPLTGATATAIATPATICAGANTSLNVVLARPGSVTVSAALPATTSSTYPNPLYSNWANNRNQTLFLASELSASGIFAGNLTSLSFPITATSATVRTGFTIKIGTTAATALTTAAFQAPAFTTVYSASYTPTVGINNFVFSTPYAWDGTSNIVVEFCWDNIASTATESSTVTAQTTAFNSVISYNRTTTTGTSICGAVNTPSTAYTTRALITFGATSTNQTATATAFSWSDGSTVVGTTNPLVQSPTVNTSYTATVTASGCNINSNAVAVTVNPRPTAPTTTGSSQCGTAVPTATVADPNGFTTPTFKWYAASTGGAALYSSTTFTYGLSIATTTTLHVSVTNPTTGCESDRTPITITVGSPPTLTVSTNQTACNNQVYPISVTSTIADYDTYVWTPITNLYTDAAGTIAYTTGASATTVYVKSTTTGAASYLCTANNTTTLCTNTATHIVTIQPALTSISAPTTTYCLSGTPTLSATPAAGYAAGTLQWKSSTTSPAGPFTDIVGATSATYTPSAALSQTTYYQLVLKDGVGTTCATTPQLTISINAPTVTSNGDVTRCGTGTVDLAATAGGGGIINWYSTLTGGAPIGTGATFTSPTISTTTPYFVSAYVPSPNSTISVGAGASTSSAGGISPYYHSWGGVKSQFIIRASELSAAGIVAGNINGLSFEITTLGTAVFNNFALSIGTTAQTVATATHVSGLTQVYTNAAQTNTLGVNYYPFATAFNWDGISNIVVQTCYSNVNAGGTSSTVKYDVASFTSSTYSYADNQSAAAICATLTGATGGSGGTLSATGRPKINFNAVGKCETTPRVQIQGLVTPPPAISVTPPAPICAGASANVSVSSTNVNYTYAWTTGGTAAGTGATVSVTPTASGFYKVTATDNLSNPVCVISDSVAVIVNPLPTITAAASASAICAGSTINLTSTANTNTTVMSEGLEAVPAGWITLTFAPSNVWAIASNAANARTGTGYASYTFNSTAAANTYLVSKAQLLTAGVTYNVSFWYRASSTSFTEKLRLYVGNAPTTTALTASAAIFDNPGFTSITYTQGTATFTPATTGNYYFGWQAYSNSNQDRIYMDDITISAATPSYNYAWTSTPASFTSSVQNPTAVTPNNGDIYNVTITNTTTNCFATASTAAIVVNPGPAAPTDVSVAAQCGAITYNVTSPVVSPTFRWYAAASGGAPVFSSATGAYTPASYTATNTIYVSVFNGTCESPRTAITVTSTPADPLTVTAAQIACNGAYTQVLVTTPTSGAGSFTSYVWSSPTAGVLYSDNVGTAYVPGTSATSVYVKSTTVGSITIDAFAVNGACSQNASTTVYVQPATATLSTLTNTYCQTGTPTISVSPAVGYAPGTLQWQSSTTGLAGSYTDIVGETGVTYTASAAITATTYYQLLVKDGTGASCLTPQITITVNNPLITGTTPGTRCGTGTVVLGAANTAGSVINWFATASGGTSLGTGTSFTTPSIAATTTYYASASVGLPVNAVIGTGTSLTSSTGELTAFCNRRDSYWSQTVYTAAELTAAGLVAGNISSISYNIASLGDAATNANYTIKIGTSATTTLSAFTTAGLTDVYGPVTQTHTIGNNVINFSTPYVWDGVSNIIVDLRHEGIDNINNAQTYYTPTVGNTTVYAYSSTITSVAALVASNPAPTTSVNRLNTTFGQLGCESVRVPVVATVTPPLPLTIDKTTDAVCTGSSSVVTVSSTLTDYDSYTWSGPAGTFVSSGTPSGQIVTLTPTVSPSVYTLTANNSVTGCVNTASVTVTINPVPAVPTSPLGYTLCQNTTIPGGSGLTALGDQAVTSFTGSLVAGPTYVRSTGASTTYTGSGVGNAVYYSTHTFKVSVTGSYTFNQCAPTTDGYGSIYTSPFTATTPATNFLIGNDDTNGTPNCGASTNTGSDSRITLTLTAGTTYVLVSSSFSNGETGAYTWTFTGPGSVLTPGGTILWYTAATGGTSIGTGSPFNPIGVAGSGVPNSATDGATTFYAAASSGLCESVRVPVVLTITPQPNATIAYTGTPYCAGGTATVTVGGTAGTTGGTYTSTAGLVINASTGDVDLTTSTAGSYVVTYSKAAAGGCALYTTTAPITIKASGTWLGVTTNWNDASNWCGGVPTSATNVIIPVVASGLYPIITSATAPLPSANNVSIAAAGATTPIITVGTGATFNINGTLSGAGLMDVVAGTINTLGATATINGANLTSNTVNTIKLSGNATISSGATPVKVTNQIDFVTPGNTLTTNDNLVLVSAATGTANIGNVNGGSIVGKVEIQRFLPAQKSWRLLATPVVEATSPTITASWREGGLNFTGNGFGTRITGADGPFLTYGPAYTGAYLDEYTIRSNMKSYNMMAGNFTDVIGYDIQTNMKIANKDGYFLFVRGDRSAASTVPLGASTTLRIKGEVRTGTQTFPVAPGKFRSIGNPFPSRIDMRTVNFNANTGAYSAWDPNPVGSFYVGRYVQYVDNFPVSGVHEFFVTPATITGVPAQRDFMESGEAFFVYNGSASSSDIVIAETDKATGYTPYVSRQGVNSPTLEINLHTTDATGADVITDGAKVNFKNNFDNAIDALDVLKITNTSDNLGIKTAGQNLIVERRKMPQGGDTIQLNISAMRMANFTLEIDPSVLANIGVTAELKDRFLQTSTPISLVDITNYSFATTTDANSKAADRFYIVFRPSVILSVNFVDIAAIKNADNTNTVKWTIANEQNVQQYEIERSDRGTNFVSIGTQAATQNVSYGFVDATPLNAINYYRIKAISINGQIQYSPIVKIAPNNKEQSIQLVVNPIIDNKIQLSFVNKTGTYSIALFNNLGQVSYTSNINVASSNELKVIEISNKLVAGVYQLVLTNSNGEKTALQVLIK